MVKVVFEGINTYPLYNLYQNPQNLRSLDFMLGLNHLAVYLVIQFIKIMSN